MKKYNLITKISRYDQDAGVCPICLRHGIRRGSRKCPECGALLKWPKPIRDITHPIKVVRDDGRIYDLLRKNALYCFVERNSGYEFPYGFRTKDDAMGRIQDIISDYKSGKLGKYSESAPK